MKAIRDWFLEIYWSWRWKRDAAWREYTVKRLAKDRERAAQRGKKFVNTALRRFVERQQAKEGAPA